MLEGTHNWNFGRRGEIIPTAVWADGGFTVLDVSSTSARAPLLHQAEVNIIAPDSLMIRRGSFWLDTKTKHRPFAWHGGSKALREAGVAPPAGSMHGIDRRSWDAYRRVEQETRRAVVICILCVETADLLANHLQGLGEPYPSVSGDFDIVNWPVSKFRVICSFDPKRLHRYFYDGDRVRDAPVTMPSPQKRAELLRWLRPQQGEMDFFRADLLARLEQLWGGEL
jgi:hypothetical protein